MLIHMTLAFTTERVDLRVERPYIHRVEANLLALERVATKPKRGPMLLDLGEKARRLAGADEAVVKAIYDPDAFEPELTAAAVAYWSMVLFQEVRPGLLRMGTVGMFDRFLIDLLLPRFERLPNSATDRFARSFGTTFWRRSDVFVNHRRLSPPRWRATQLWRKS